VDDISIGFDLAPFRRWVSDLVKKQIPFATALATTRVAKDAQAELQDEIDEHFISRTKFVERGVRIKAASKARPIAHVGSRDEFMRLQAEGGTKEGQGDGVAVPVGARLRPTSRTPPGKWPGAVLKKARHFTQKLPSGDKGVFRRMGRGRSRKVRLLWHLTNKVNVPKRWPIRETVERVVRKQWRKRAKEALRQALKTARR